MVIQQSKYNVPRLEADKFWWIRCRPYNGPGPSFNHDKLRVTLKENKVLREQAEILKLRVEALETMLEDFNGQDGSVADVDEITNDTEDTLSNSDEEVGGSKGKIRCTIQTCFRLILEKNFDKHMEKVHKSLGCSYNKCSASFDDQDTLSQHLGLHASGALAFVDEPCQRWFREHRVLKEHQKSSEFTCCCERGCFIFNTVRTTQRGGESAARIGSERRERIDKFHPRGRDV